MAAPYPIQRFIDGYAHFVTPLEATFMQRLARWWSYPWLTDFFRLVSRLGDWPLWTGTGVMLFLAGGARGRLALGAALVSAGLAIGLFTLVKHVVRRPRPYESWSQLSCLVAPPDRFSFPSGHTLTAFAMYGTLGTMVPGLGFVLLPAAGLIGLSRIFLGAHYPTDVLIGGVLGTVLGRMVAWGFIG
jgi:undecaprenyl-diphosphatase